MHTSSPSPFHTGLDPEMMVTYGIKLKGRVILSKIISSEKVNMNYT